MIYCNECIISHAKLRCHTGLQMGYINLMANQKNTHLMLIKFIVYCDYVKIRPLMTK